MTEIPALFMTLWPKLRTAVRMIEGGRECPEGIFFVTKDDQGMDACHAVSHAFGGEVVEYSQDRISEADFRERVSDVVLRRDKQKGLFNQPVERLTVIIPELDRRGEWLQLRLKFLFEHAKIHFLALATVRDEKKLASYLGGHYSLCRKKGAAKGSRRKTRQKRAEAGG